MTKITKKFLVLTILVVSAVTWSSSITNQYTGYDDIKLIASNDIIHKGPAATFETYGHSITSSNNTAWTNRPSMIFRPLEWMGSAIGYQIWGNRPWCFHLFFNFAFHLLNSVLIFVLLCQLLTEIEPLEKLEKKFKNIKSNELLAGIITLIWTVHPVHNEAVNMLTSGTGFLLATLLGTAAIWINLNKNTLLWIFLANVFFFIALCGSEMQLTLPINVLLFFLLLKNLSEHYWKFCGPFVAIALYFIYRTAFSSELGIASNTPAAELIERIFVLAPQVFFHYIKLFFAPITMTIDQHHQVFVDEPMSLYHLFTLTFGFAFLYAIYHFARQERYSSKIIALGLGFALINIGIALNIFHIYCMARERYAYFFTLGLMIAVVTWLYQRFFIKQELDKSLKLQVNQQTILVTLAVFTIAFMGRSFVRNFDWANGEKFWMSTIQTCPDVGAQQVWRSSLLRYYSSQGKEGFTPDPEAKKQALNDFYNFIGDNNLTNNIKEKVAAYKDRPFRDKYAYGGRKTIASGLSFLAKHLAGEKKFKEVIQVLELAHTYFPEHLDTNISLLGVIGTSNAKFEKYLRDKIYNTGKDTLFYGMNFLETLYSMKHPEHPFYAKHYYERFPGVQAFEAHYMFALIGQQQHDEAYKVGLEMLKKPGLSKGIKQYLANQEIKRFGRIVHVELQ